MDLNRNVSFDDFQMVDSAMFNEEGRLHQPTFIKELHDHKMDVW
jgi:hypothetical protein